MVTRITLVLNTDRTKASVLVWREVDQFRNLFGRAKAKLGTHKKVSRLFVCATGEEIRVNNSHRILFDPSHKGILTICVSCGEDFIGTTVLPEVIVHMPILPTWIRGDAAVVASEIGSVLSPFASTIVAYLFEETLHGPLWPATDWGSPTLSQADIQLRLSVAKQGGMRAPQARALERTLKTRVKYDTLLGRVHHNQRRGVTTVPPGVRLIDFGVCPDYIDSITGMQAELDALFQLVATQQRELKKRGYEMEEEGDISNLRMYVNTAYFARNSNDPWPMLQMTDPRLVHTSRLIRAAVAAFGGPVELVDSPRLNVVIRRYHPNYTLGFHADRNEFGDCIYGLVAVNTLPHRGLVLTSPGQEPFAAFETPGLAWCLQGPSRSEWEHGYCAPEASTEGVDTFAGPLLRTSVTFRFFEDANSAPVYDPRNNI